MIEITRNHINRLIELESTVQYDEPPPEGINPFIMVNRDSSILISAPHGAKTFRETDENGWHEEDEYTAGMALLLGEVCDVSIIAMTSRSDLSDPNHHDVKDSEYKQVLQKILASGKVKYVIDLHGAAEDSKHLAVSQLVDLGIGNSNEYLPKLHRKKLVELIEAQLGTEVTNRKGKTGFPAASKKRIRIANFCHNHGVHSVQIEMKPELRIASRKEDSSAFKKDRKEYAAPEDKLMGIIQALVDFIDYLKEQTK